MLIKPSILKGEITPPPSKSISHRALILGALASSGSIISNLLQSEDVLATKSSLELMGAKFKEKNNLITVEKGISQGYKLLDCKNSGTTLRLMMGVVALFQQKSTLTGDESLRNRPIGELTQALKQLGASVSDNNGKAPVSIAAGEIDNQISCIVSGKYSSQFISSLLIHASKRGKNTEMEICITPPINSKPYIELTKLMLENAGIEITESKNTFFVKGENKLLPVNYKIPVDYSSAAFFLVAGALSKNDILIQGLTDHLPQADSRIIGFLEEMGAQIQIKSNTIKVSHNELNAIEADLSNCPDLFPILSVACGLAKGKSVLYGAEHLKYKETNRIETTSLMLQKFGIKVENTIDGAIITGSSPKGGIEINSFGDHRIAMAASILATQSDKPVKINDAECVKISYPGFFFDLNNLIENS